MTNRVQFFAVSKKFRAWFYAKFTAGFKICSPPVYLRTRRARYCSHFCNSSRHRRQRKLFTDHIFENSWTFSQFFFNFWQLLILVDFTRLSNRRKSKQWRGVGGLRGQLSVSLFAHHAKGKWGAHSAVYGARRRATKNDMKNYKKNEKS